MSYNFTQENINKIKTVLFAKINAIVPLKSKLTLNDIDFSVVRKGVTLSVKPDKLNQNYELKKLLATHFLPKLKKAMNDNVRTFNNQEGKYGIHNDDIPSFLQYLGVNLATSADIKELRQPEPVKQQVQQPLVQQNSVLTLKQPKAVNRQEQPNKIMNNKVVALAAPAAVLLPVQSSVTNNSMFATKSNTIVSANENSPKSNTAIQNIEAIYRMLKKEDQQFWQKQCFFGTLLNKIPYGVKQTKDLFHDKFDTNGKLNLLHKNPDQVTDIYTELKSIVEHAKSRSSLFRGNETRNLYSKIEESVAKYETEKGCQLNTGALKSIITINR